MPSTPPSVAVRTAERPGSPDKPTEDRIFTTGNAVIVLDGASQPEAIERNGGWLAQHLGATLADHLTAYPGADLTDALGGSIASVAHAHNLTPGDSPSTTVTIVRWTDTKVDVLVLCDSPALVLTTDGTIHLVQDDRLAAVTAQLAGPRGYNVDDPSEWRRMVDAQRQHRNRAGGYWVAEATPDAANHAIRASWPVTEVAIAFAMTDGVAIGVERYGNPSDWHAAAAIASQDPSDLVGLVHRTEESDLDGSRWPRSKVHDDKALAAITLNELDGVPWL